MNGNQRSHGSSPVCTVHDVTVTFRYISSRVCLATEPRLRWCGGTGFLRGALNLKSCGMVFSYTYICRVAKWLYRIRQVTG